MNENRFDFLASFNSIWIKFCIHNIIDRRQESMAYLQQKSEVKSCTVKSVSNGYFQYVSVKRELGSIVMSLNISNRSNRTPTISVSFRNDNDTMIKKNDS